MEITKRIEFDTGHRVPSHKSKCRNIHGHRYILEVTMRGPIKPIRGETDDGMVIDFSDIKDIATREISDLVDHAFVIYENDLQCRQAVAAMDPDHRTVLVPFIPTAENLSQWFFDILDSHYQEVYGEDLMLQRVRLYETPNSWADSVRPEPLEDDFDDIRPA